MKEQRYKYRIFPISITRKGEKKSFQLRLPQSACKITGVLVTSTAGKSDCGKKLEKIASFLEIKQRKRDEYRDRLVFFKSAAYHN